MRKSNNNNNNYDKEHLLCLIVMNSNQRLTCIVIKQLNRDNKKRRFLIRGQQSVFCQCHSSRTSYHDRTYWLQYRINLFTRVLVGFQHKTNISLNYRIDPQIFLRLSTCT